MANLILSAFADEYADNLIEQCKALNSFGIKYMEVRGVDGKNVSTLDKKQAEEAKVILDDYGIKPGGSVGARLAELDGAGGKYAYDAHVKVLKRTLFL